MTSPRERAADYFRRAARAAEKGEWSTVRDEVAKAGDELREAQRRERETPHVAPPEYEP